jgi:hypothetical protein
MSMYAMSWVLDTVLNRAVEAVELLAVLAIL